MFELAFTGFQLLVAILNTICIFMLYEKMRKLKIRLDDFSSATKDTFDLTNMEQVHIRHKLAQYKREFDHYKVTVPGGDHHGSQSS